jgi:hypothetical protein
MKRRPDLEVDTWCRPLPSMQHDSHVVEPLALMRWLDVVLLVASVPVLLLAGLPTLGVLAGAGGWALQRVAAYWIERKARESGNAKTYAGLMMGSTLARSWLIGLSILAVGLAGAREDGLVAAVIVFAAFTVYFALSLILRPLERSSARP